MSAYDDLRVELDNTKHVNNTTERERIVAGVTARALVDVAETLASMLALMSADKLELKLDPDEGVDGGPDRDPDAEPDPSVNLGPLDIGDEVAHKTGEPLGVITSIGESEGMGFAIVKAGNGDDESVKVWLDELERVVHEVAGAIAGDPFDDPADADLEQEATDAFAALKNRAR